MQSKIIFREMLSEIKALADRKGNVLTQKEIKDFFANAHLEEAQFVLIYEYLHSQKIKVEGFVPLDDAGQKAEAKGAQEAGKTAETENGADVPDFLGMYLEEVEALQPFTEAEEYRLFEEAVRGSRTAKNRLAEQYLKMVYELSVTYVGTQILQEDLIQEGNMGLLMFLETMERQESLEAYREQLFCAVQSAMEAAIETTQDTREMDEEIAGRVNHLNEAVLNLEKDLGHKVSVEELSIYLEMPAEEIRDVLRMAGDEMKSE